MSLVNSKDTQPDDAKDDEHILSETSSEQQENDQDLKADKKVLSSRASSPELTRIQSNSSIPSKPKQSPVSVDLNEEKRPSSPKISGRRAPEPKHPILKSQGRARSNSPKKTFSYASPDCFNLNKWRQYHRQLAKEEENNRIYHENRKKLERLARIAREPSSYPAVHVEQERLREQHALNHRRKVLKSYIPILQGNLYLVTRLANIKGTYDFKKMNEDYIRYTSIRKQDAANRQKTRQLEAEKPFILPKLKTGS